MCVNDAICHAIKKAQMVLVERQEIEDEGEGKVTKESRSQYLGQEGKTSSG